MWHLEGRRARLQASELTGTWNLEQPTLGLTELEFGGVRCPELAVLQVRMPIGQAGAFQLLDGYVRGPELVANYATPLDQRISSRLCWRTICYPDMAAIGIELILSVSTELLDSDPRFDVGSEWPACPVLSLAVPAATAWQELPLAPGASQRLSSLRAGAVLCRLPGDVSYLELVHPADFSSGELRASQAGRVQAAFSVFEKGLEKGVLRRSRLQGLFLTRKDDEAVALACARRFAAASAPLD